MNKDADFIQDFQNAKNAEDKAALIAETILSTFSNGVAHVAHQCVLFHWFDQSIVEGLLLAGSFNAESAQTAYEQITSLPFIEQLPWGAAYQDLTRQGLLKRYAQTQPELLKVAASIAAPLYRASGKNDKHAFEILFCSIILGDPASHSHLNRLLEQAMSQQNWQQMESLLRLQEEAERLPFVDALPRTERYWMLRSIVDRIQGRLHEAISDYDHVLTLNPNNALIYLNRSILLIQQQQHTQALADYRKAFRLDPSLVQTYIIRGAIPPLHEHYANNSNLIPREHPSFPIMSDFTFKDFFISYAQENWDAAKWIKQQLEEAGYSTVLPSRDFLAGRNFTLEMDAATQARRTIAVLSPDYLASKFTQPEWAAALRQDPTGVIGLLLPVRIARCDVQGFLAQLIYIDLVDQNEETARKILLAGVQQTPKMLKPAEFSFLTEKAAPLLSAGPKSISSPRFGAPFPANWNVSRRHAFYFTGREKQLEQIFQEFVARDPAQLTAPQALVGLGGLGKTQTAAEYAYRYRGEYQSVLWARADKLDNLKTDFQLLTRLLNLPEQEDPIEIMQAWFTANTDWLLILDNADDLDLMAHFFPRSPRGHVLVTTRAMAAGNIARSFLLQPLHPEDGALCMLRRAGTVQWHENLSNTSAFNVDAAINTSILMDGLPLALEQAGAYIEDTGSSANRYLKLYEEHRTRIIQEQHGALPNYPLPVAAAWEISKKIVKERPMTFEFLQLCAFLAPEAIPEEIFMKGADALGPTLETGVSDQLDIDRVTASLRRYSLLNREVNKTDDLARFSMHRIIQEILRDEMDEATRQCWAERAVRAVVRAHPFIEQELLQAQVNHCLTWVDQWQMTFPEAEQLRLLAEKFIRKDM